MWVVLRQVFGIGPNRDHLPLDYRSARGLAGDVDLVVDGGAEQVAVVVVGGALGLSSTGGVGGPDDQVVTSGPCRATAGG